MNNVVFSFACQHRKSSFIDMMCQGVMTISINSALCVTYYFTSCYRVTHLELQVTVRYIKLWMEVIWGLLNSYFRKVSVFQFIEVNPTLMVS